MSEQLKRQFTQRIIELQQRIDSIHKDFAGGRDADWAEQAGERENDEVLNALESEAKVEIQQLSNAIMRIDNGHYGICQQCGDEIAEQRLAVQPAALTCIQCAQ
ncbi:TraR/DksA family transcriptional regulator [Litorilituus lipolyticus]|uniref:TraR/DksA family transcriptional regulator n=1 Tax=Litorilituus lipolyticus TaxID=2491017 RepID=A0A502KPC2_9GAMM|nr:TraR/DksA family transcriptional regulator [Litorilituus lipolyticus]TPH13472.1 TraR/DksA family transcriptional regulator [Litorilituus lipolyticus]